MEGECDCAVSDGIEFCQHCVAVALHLQEQETPAKSIDKRGALRQIRRYLSTMTHEELLDEFLERVKQDRASIRAWIKDANLLPDDFLWLSRNRNSKRLSMSQYSRIIKQLAEVVGADPTTYATHSIRRTKVTLIYRKTQNLRACQLLLGHKKIENTVRYLGLELDEALEISRDIDI